MSVGGDRPSLIPYGGYVAIDGGTPGALVTDDQAADAAVVPRAAHEEAGDVEGLAAHPALGARLLALPVYSEEIALELAVLVIGEDGLPQPHAG